MSKNVYEMVTDRIIEQLENGVIPWEKPWTGVRDGAYNRVSKKSYSILNQMLLKHKGEYATFKQWQELGGHIRKGEKSEIIVFWKIYPSVGRSGCYRLWYSTEKRLDRFGSLCQCKTVRIDSCFQCF